MAEYAMREQSYGKVMAGQLKAFLESIVIGDQHLQDIAIARSETIFSAPNFDIKAMMSLLGIEPGLEFSASLPRIMAENLAPLLIEEAEIEGHMDVHATEEQESHSKVDTAIDTEIKAGWGPVSAKIKVHAQASVATDHKRGSDYSTGVKWRVLLRKQAPPETLVKLVDSLVQFFNKVTDINESLANAKVEELKAKTAALPPDADGSDDSGGGDTPENQSAKAA